MSLPYGLDISLSRARRLIFSRSRCTSSPCLLARRLLVTPRRIPAKRMGPPLSTRGQRGARTQAGPAWVRIVPHPGRIASLVMLADMCIQPTNNQSMVLLPFSTKDSKKMTTAASHLLLVCILVFLLPVLLLFL